MARRTFFDRGAGFVLASLAGPLDARSRITRAVRDWEASAALGTTALADQLARSIGQRRRAGAIMAVTSFHALARAFVFVADPVLRIRAWVRRRRAEVRPDAAVGFERAATRTLGARVLLRRIALVPTNVEAGRRGAAVANCDARSALAVCIDSAIRTAGSLVARLPARTLCRVGAGGTARTRARPDTTRTRRRAQRLTVFVRLTTALCHQVTMHAGWHRALGGCVLDSAFDACVRATLTARDRSGATRVVDLEVRQTRHDLTARECERADQPQSAHNSPRNVTKPPALETCGRALRTYSTGESP